jgi:hypothetical protein
VVLHVDDVVVGLGEAAGDGLEDAKYPVQEIGSKEGVVDEVVGDAVDVGVDHQGVEEADGEHDPEGDMREEEVHADEPGEVEERGKGGNDVPPGMREELGVRGGTLDIEDVGAGHRKRGFYAGKPDSQVRLPREGLA